MFVISITIGIMQETGIGDIPTPLCLAKLNFIGKTLILMVQGLMCLVMTALNAALSTHIRQTRKATGRTQTNTNNVILARFTLYNLVTILAFGLQVIWETVEINQNVVKVVLLLSQLAIAPISFPVIFVLTTRQFKGKVGRICGCQSVKQPQTVRARRAKMSIISLQ